MAGRVVAQKVTGAVITVTPVRLEFPGTGPRNAAREKRFAAHDIFAVVGFQMGCDVPKLGFGTKLRAKCGSRRRRNLQNDAVFFSLCSRLKFS